MLTSTVADEGTQRISASDDNHASLEHPGATLSPPLQSMPTREILVKPYDGATDHVQHSTGALVPGSIEAPAPCDAAGPAKVLLWGRPVQPSRKRLFFMPED